MPITTWLGEARYRACYATRSSGQGVRCHEAISDELYDTRYAGAARGERKPSARDYHEAMRLSLDDSAK